MKNNYTYLKDVAFLKEVTRAHIQTYYIKINILNWNELFVDNVQGRVISGSINIDGKSSIRRTLSLSFYVDGLTQSITRAENLLSINKKIQVEIGIKNIFDAYTEYETLWFPQGIYVVSSCTISNDSNGRTVNLQAKDKMCLLNGECGGTFPATTQLDIYDTIDSKGQWTTARPTIYQIIQELVNHFGGEQLGKIIISDVDPLVKYVVKWTGDTPLYRLHAGGNGWSQYTYTTNFADIPQDQQKGWILGRQDIYNYGDDVGFKYTDFTYPESTNPDEQSNFVCEAGSTVTDALDKIISQVLGNYEYFYDVNGNFIFRQIKNYLNNAQSKYISQYKMRNNDPTQMSVFDQYLLPDYINKENYSPYLFEIDKGTSAISFANDNDLIISYNNSPQYGLIKNDIIVWGIRKSIDGYEFPLRYHLAIDTKPPITYKDEKNIDQPLTYRAFKVEQDGYETWYATIPITTVQRPYPGTVGLYYEKYTEAGPNSKPTGEVDTWNPKTQQYEEVTGITVQDITVKDWRTALLLQGTIAERNGTDSNYYYAELKYEWPKIYDVENGCYRESTILHPEQINYFLDFVDAGSYLDQLSVQNIGRRTKVLNEKNNVNCVFEPDIPDLIFINTSQVSKMLEPKKDAQGNPITDDKENVITYESEMQNYMQNGRGLAPTTPTYENNMQRIFDYCLQYGQPYFKLEQSIFNNLALGGQLNSAYQVVRQLLQEYVSYNESVTIQCLPMYFLQPNERITLYNPESDVYGDYIIDSMNFSFDVSSTLTINASRVLTKI